MNEICLDHAMTLQAIGTIHTPFKALAECPKNSRFCNERCTLTIDPAFADALLDIDSASHLFVFYWLDQSDRSVLARPTPHDGVTRGVFATRAPARPNPIGLSVVKLYSRDGTTLHVGGLDCLDGTPLIDIKPYLASNDCVPDATVSWNNG